MERKLRLRRIFNAPSAAKRAIELDDDIHSIQFDLYQRILGGEEELLFLQHFVVTRIAQPIALLRNLYRLVISIDGASLLRFRLG